MTNVAIENGPFIVDLPTKNVIFNSYVSLPEGRWQTSHDFGWVETPSQIGGAGFRWPIHSRNALAMGEGRSIVNAVLVEMSQIAWELEIRAFWSNT